MITGADRGTLVLPELMRIVVTVSPPVTVGLTPHGEVRLVPFVGGTFDGGADLRGVVLPGGTDWQTVRADGALEIRAHYLLETDAGERVEVVSEGIRHGSATVLARLAAGDPVDPREYYFRTAVRLSTGAERLAHLNDLLAVASGERRTDSVHLTVYAVP